MCVSLSIILDACVLCHHENLADCYTLSDPGKESEESSAGLSCHSLPNPLLRMRRKRKELAFCLPPTPSARNSGEVNLRGKWYSVTLTNPKLLPFRS